MKGTRIVRFKEHNILSFPRAYAILIYGRVKVRYRHPWLECFLLSFFCLFDFHWINTARKWKTKYGQDSWMNRKRRIFVLHNFSSATSKMFVPCIYSFFFVSYFTVSVFTYPNLNKLLRRIPYYFASECEFKRGGHFPHAGYSTLSNIPANYKAVCNCKTCVLPLPHRKNGLETYILTFNTGTFITNIFHN